MKNTDGIWRVVAAVVIVVLLIGAGFAIYGLGYKQGKQAAQAAFEERYPRRGLMMDGFDGNGRLLPQWDEDLPSERVVKLRPFEHTPAQPTTFFLVGGFFKLGFLILILWLIYKFITALTVGQGWQLTFKKLPLEEKKGKKKK